MASALAVMKRNMTVRLREEVGLAPSPKPSKYRNIKCHADGKTFDSKREMAKYYELQLLVRAGEIFALEHHPVYKLHSAKGDVIGRFTPDFRYQDATGRIHVIDVKSPATANETAFRLRRKLFESEYGISLEIVK